MRREYILVLCLTVGLAVGCSKQLGVVASSPPDDKSHALPFERVPENKGLSPTSKFVPQDIPSGTAICIRLRTALSSAKSRAGDRFEAVLDQPILSEGQTIASRGAIVTGRVVAAKPGLADDPGYLRLTLSTISVNGQNLPLKTSSVFHKASVRMKPAGLDPVSSTSANKSAEPMFDVTFSTARRLTFLLVQPVRLQG